MKFPIAILFIFLIGCKSTKPQLTSDKVVQSEDTLKKTEEKLKIEKLEELPQKTSSSIDNSTEKPPVEMFIKSRPTQKQRVTNAKIIDRSEEVNNRDKNFETGKLAYSIPDKMQVGKFYTITLRISKEEMTQEIIIGGSKIPINDTLQQSTITIEKIRVSSVMSSELIGEEGSFEIKALSTSLQNIEDFGYTEWQWSIKPLKSGMKFLKIIVRVRVVSGGEEFYKDLKVYEGKVPVSLNASFTIVGFLNQYWQWLMTTVIIPLIIWFWKKRDDKKGKKKK